MKVLTLLVCCLSLTVQYSHQFRLKTNSSTSEESHSSAIVSETESEDSVTRIETEEPDTDKCFQCLDLHYFGHYLAKQCLPRQVDEDCQPDFCPKYFDCPEESSESKESTKSSEFCLFDKKKFPLESVIETGDPCRECLCKSAGNSTEIACTQSDCPPEVFENLQPDCFRKYSKDKCCPEVICDAKLSAIKCEFEGQDYKYGDQFSPMNDPCQSCVCDEFWNSTLPVMEMSCSKIKCHFETKDDSCVPVYSPNTCCPLDYHCPKESDGEDEPKCHFGSQTYSIGDKVHHEKRKESTKCLECTCIVPPEVTCSMLDC